MGAFMAAAPAIMGKAALGTAASYGANAGLNAAFGSDVQNATGGADPMQDPNKLAKMQMIAALLRQMQQQQGMQMGMQQPPQQPIQMES